MVPKRPPDPGYCWRRIGYEARNRALQREIDRCQRDGKVWIYEWVLESTLPAHSFYQIEADPAEFREIEADWKVSLVDYDAFQLVLMTPEEKEREEAAPPVGVPFNRCSVAPLKQPEELA